MTKNQTRDFLRQYKLAAMRLESLTAEHERIQSVLFSITSSQGASSRSSNDRIGNGVSRLIDLLNGIDKEIEYYTKVRSDVKAVVAEVTRANMTLGQCLHYRYIDFDSAETCAFRMGYHPSHERKLHARAILAAAKILENMSANARVFGDIV